jgi:nucleotide-binding universal stress UspA family protein
MSPWIVALDTRGSCRGAIVFSKWLQSRGMLVDDELVGVHVVERAQVPTVSGRPLRGVDWLGERARQKVEAIVATAGTNPLQRILWEDGVAAEDALVDVCDRIGAVGMIIGRRAPTRGGHLVRLGKTARRVLRRLPVPIITVPPDFQPLQHADGPVLCGVDLADHCAPAARLAAAWADALGRRLQIVHAFVVPKKLELHEDDAAARQHLVDELLRETKVRLNRWCEQQGLSSRERTVVVGDPETVIQQRVDASGVPLVVCGSRQLDLVRRIFGSSLASHLAASLPVPLMVVPPER